MRWEALPPRQFSNRGQHRRIRNSALTNKEKSDLGSNAVSIDETQAWLRKNTPGLNSYLKVELDKRTLDQLYDMTKSKSSPALRTLKETRGRQKAKKIQRGS